MVNHISKALSSRDLQILAFIAKFNYCQERHLSILFNQSSSTIARAVKSLADDDYLAKRKILSDTSSYLFLTSKSGKLLSLKPVTNVVLNTLYHDTLVIDLYFYLLKAGGLSDSDEVLSDRELRRKIGINKPATSIRQPDLLINGTIAIELEISEKPKARLQHILNTYIIDDKVESVKYYLLCSKLAQKIYELTAGHSKFQFYILTIADNMQISAEAYQQAVTQAYASTSGKTFGGFKF